jgi:hypothetical protein
LIGKNYLALTALDENKIRNDVHGLIPLQTRDDESQALPLQLFDAGHHFEDVPHNL